MSPADMAAVTRNNENDGMFGGNGAWWIIVLLLFVWGRGFGGMGGNVGEPCATQSDVRAAVDQQTLISKLDQQTYGLADSTYALNNTINQNFRTVDNAICTLGYTIQGGFNSLASQLAARCCDIQRGIDGVNYNVSTTACAITNTINNSTRDIIENQNANSRAILDYLCQDKISMFEDDGYSGRYYDDGESYASRGMHYVRGHYSRGKDSYEGGSSSRREYSRDGGKEKLYDMLRVMMDEAESERKREAYRKMIEQLERE